MTPLPQRMIEDLQVRNFSPTTQRAYIYAVAQPNQNLSTRTLQAGCLPDGRISRNKLRV